MGNLITSIDKIPKGKKLIVFDLDGTLVKSKTNLDPEMAGLLEILLGERVNKKVAIIGGAKYELFKRQVLGQLGTPGVILKNLFLFPVTATAFYRFNGGTWEEIYSESFSEEEKRKIFNAFEKTFQEFNYKHPYKIYGELIEDRGGQITFSALGNEAPLEAKEKWNKENPDIRSKMEKVLQNNLPNMEIKVAGLTSIDVTGKGIDKEYGIRQVSKYLNIPIQDMIFVGDAFFPEGNDEAALKTGVLCFEVKGVEDTKELIKYILKTTSVG